jgi:N-acetylglucosaminyl-diphospho-decaprenol L-rhamnosyltransferase
MILSVVIVSYNVKFFLEQCLSSLKKAIDGSSILSHHAEVFIVDNASADGSLDFLVTLYPEFRFIENDRNIGFAKANNKALSQCSGEFILFLNPDTILAEDSLDTCLSFLRSTPDTGAVGLRMIDGTGRYLRESKRGFPDPMASFFKMTGFARLFPRSKFFSAYYMGHLDERRSHAVDVLSGAFMMTKKTILDTIGGFDEQFFMYAEDIDLSYRIQQTGHQNYYLSQSTIIHFKGESTRKDFRYVKMFYTAMELFMKKHFKNNGSSLPLFSLRLGVKLHRAIAHLVLPFKKLESKSGLRPIVCIRGEPGEQQKWKRRLEEKSISVSVNAKLANEMIYCESASFSWKSIITEITNTKSRIKYMFHGSGTHAAVGSNSSRQQGNVFEI